SRNIANVVFKRFTNVHQHKLFAAIQLLSELDSGNGRNIHLLCSFSFGLRNATKLIIIDQFMNSGMLSANWAFRIFANLEFSKSEFERIEAHEAADQRITQPDNKLNGLNRLQDADNAW